jgi:hypothetical protein
MNGKLLEGFEAFKSEIKDTAQELIDDLDAERRDPPIRQSRDLIPLLRVAIKRLNEIMEKAVDDSIK